ncbi:hypothetical protein BJ742DRAFT_809485 [Cladochytrium replicatum]|nr:hypothetical protein BJ742DRAFT_809485 [Cladochytrium replicatum]
MASLPTAASLQSRNEKLAAARKKLKNFQRKKAAGLEASSELSSPPLTSVSHDGHSVHYESLIASNDPHMIPPAHSMGHRASVSSSVDMNTYISQTEKETSHRRPLSISSSNDGITPTLYELVAKQEEELSYLRDTQMAQDRKIEELSHAKHELTIHSQNLETELLNARRENESVKSGLASAQEQREVSLAEELRASKEQASAYIEELNRRENTIRNLTNEREGLQTANAEIQSQLQQVDGRWRMDFDEIRSKVGFLKSELASKSEALTVAQQEISDANIAHDLEVSQLNRTVQQLQDQLAHISFDHENRIRAKDTEIAQIRDELNRNIELLAITSNATSSADEIVAQLKARLSEAADDRASLEKKLAGVELEVNEQREKAILAESHLEKANAQLESTLKTSSREQEDLLRQLNDLRSTHGSMEAHVNHLLIEISNLRAEKDASQGNGAQLSDQIRNLQSDNDSLRVQNQALSVSFENAKAEIALLQGALEESTASRDSLELQLQYLQSENQRILHEQSVASPKVDEHANELDAQIKLNAELTATLASLKEEAASLIEMNESYARELSVVREAAASRSPVVSSVTSPSMKGTPSRVITEEESESILVHNGTLQFQVEQLTAQNKEILERLGEERHKNTLLTAELDSLPDYIALYRQERKALMDQVQRLAQKLKQEPPTTADTKSPRRLSEPEEPTEQLRQAYNGVQKGGGVLLRGSVAEMVCCRTCMSNKLIVL